MAAPYTEDLHSSAELSDAPDGSVNSRTAWRTFFATWNGALGSAILTTLILAGGLRSVLTPYPPDSQSFPRLLSPNSHNLFGTDELGRDILSRVIYAIPNSLELAIVSASMACVIGVLVGLTVGYFGRWLDTIMMRAVDVLMAIPGIVVALVTVAILGPGTQNLIIAIGVGWSPIFIRLVRASTLACRSQDYVLASRVVGAGTARILFKTILPNVAPVVIVQLVISMSEGLAVGASLSFLGLGPLPPTPSWGGMLQTGWQYMYSAPTYAILPGLALVLTIAAFDMIGRGLQEALGVVAPRSRGLGLR